MTSYKFYLKSDHKDELCSQHMPELSSVDVRLFCPGRFSVVTVPGAQQKDSLQYKHIQQTLTLYSLQTLQHYTVCKHSHTVQSANSHILYSQQTLTQNSLETLTHCTVCKLENFNYLNLAFISYKLTMWN